MAEVLARFLDWVIVKDGKRYGAQACGAPMADGLWEGWIEFIPLDDGVPVRSPRETTQPNRTDAVYWATGLTPVYLEGCLERTLHRSAPRFATGARPLFSGPAASGEPAGRDPIGHAVLDPFSVYEKGEGLLKQELSALSAWHLVNIIVAYRLSDEPVSALNEQPAALLVNLIVDAVRRAVPAR